MAVFQHTFNLYSIGYPEISATGLIAMISNQLSVSTINHSEAV